MTRSLSQTGRRGFTLAEMIAAVAMLALFSVFIVQMFAKADQVTQKTRILDQAVACASDLADQWKMDSSAGVLEQILDLRQNRQVGRTATVSFDAGFQICPASQAVFRADLSLAPWSTAPEAAVCPLEKAAQISENGLWQLTLVISHANPSDSRPVYTLQATRYFPKEVAAP